MHVKQEVKEYGEWLDSLCRWQVMVTLRLPPSTRSDAMRQLVQQGLIRPLAKFTKQQIIAVGAFVEEPAHAHLLLHGVKTNLVFLAQDATTGLLHSLTCQKRDPLLFRGKSLELEAVYSSGAAEYVADNLTQKHSPALANFWTFNWALANKTKQDKRI